MGCGRKMVQNKRSQVHSINASLGTSKNCILGLIPDPIRISNWAVGGDDPVLQVVPITSLRPRVTDVVTEPTDSRGQEH